MNIALAFDTETTGLPLFKEPSEHPDQPHIVQLAAVLVELDTRRELACMDVIVKPEGWTIPAEVSAIHGITQEHALDVGIPEAVAVEMLLALWAQRTRIAHNEQFDARIVRIACMRHAPAFADSWKAGHAECTQLLSTPILNLPPTEKMKRAGFNRPKSANLGEAYEFFTGRKLENAHSAMADTRACLEVFHAVKNWRGHKAEASQATAVAAGSEA